MVSTLVEEKIEPKKLQSDLERELHGEHSYEDGFVGMRQPTELDPIDIPTSVDTGKKHNRPLTQDGQELADFLDSHRSSYTEDYILSKEGYLSSMNAISKKRKVKRYDDGSLSYKFNARLDRVRDYIKKVVENKTQAKVLDLDLSVFDDDKQIIEVLDILDAAEDKGVLTSDQKHHIEDMLSPDGKETKKFDVEEKKSSSVIDVPKKKMKIEIPAGEIKIPDRAYSPTAEAILKKETPKSRLLEKTRESVSENTNFFESQAAIKSFKEGEMGDSLVHIEKIKDDAIHAETIGQIVEECAKQKDVIVAQKFLSRIRPRFYGYKTQLADWFIQVTGKNILEKNSTDTPFVGDLSIKDERENPVEEVVDLPLNVESETPVEPETENIDLEKEIKDQIVEVKKVEKSDDKARAESLARLRILERHRDSIRTPKIEKVETKKEPPVVEKVDVAKAEDVERKQEAMDKVREGYAQAYVDWEIKSRSQKRMFGRLLQDLGVTKNAPSRLSEKNSSFIDAENDYIKAMKDLGIDPDYDSKKNIFSERLLLDNRKNEIRKERAESGKDGELEKDVKVLDKALNVWNKKNSKQKIAISAALLTGVGAVAPVDYGRDYFEGMRVSHDLVNSIPNAPKDGFKEIEKISTIKAPEGFEFATESVKILKPETIIDQSKDIKLEKKLPAADLVEAVEIKDEPLVLAKDVSVEEAENTVSASSPEKSNPKPTEKIYFGNSVLEVKSLENGAKAVTFDGIEIAHEYDQGGTTEFYLDEQFQQGSKFNNIREAFSVFIDQKMFDRDNLVPKIEFESGRIDVVKNPVNLDGFLVYLNGREVARGEIKGKKVDVETIKNLKGKWFEADTVYERAAKVAKKSVQASLKK